MRSILCLFCAAWLALAITPGRGQETPMRNYQVYSPTVERYMVHNQETGATKYNHCATVAWFRDRWVCLWNANTVAKESEPGQLIYMSTSRDGKIWTPEQLAFAPGDERSENPIPCKHVQWQPTLIVVEDELWCFWSQLSHGAEQDYYGTYFSVLDDPDGQWVNRRILFEGEPDPTLEGISWRILPMQNPAMLSTGRLLVPIIMIGPKVPEAPDETGVWANEKRNSVLYSDDRGQTWHISPGTWLKEGRYLQWEPTVYEEPGGTVGMVARSNHPEYVDAPGPDWAKTLTYSQSKDGGATWAPLRVVPIETVVSRMHVLRGDGRWKPAPARNLRYIMCHNDARHGMPFGVRDRDTLALFFQRGPGFDFTAGIPLTGRETVVNYPHMWMKDDLLMVAYSQGVGSGNIKVAHVSPLPDPDQLYLLPRGRPWPDSPKPGIEKDLVHFHAHQWLDTPEPLDLSDGVFSAGAWVYPEIKGVLLDNRTEDRGFVWTLPGRQELYMPGVGSIRTRLPWMRFWNWNYVGITVDTNRGEVLFYRYQAIDGETSATRTFDPAKAPPLTADTLRIGYPRPESSLIGFTGDIAFAAVYPGERFGAAEHRALVNRFAADLNQTPVNGAGPIQVEPACELAPRNQTAFQSDFIVPKAGQGGMVEHDKVEARDCLIFHGEAAAGVELDSNDRAAGDLVHIEFEFYTDSGNEMVVATTGDAADPVRLVAREGQLVLTAEVGEAPCGPIRPETWNRVEIDTAGKSTRARLNDGGWARVNHETPATWIYLGQGFRTGELPTDSRFAVAIASVKSGVVHDDAKAIEGMD